MDRLLSLLTSTFDLVIVDAPPIGPVSDAVVLAPMMDKIVLVVRWHHTPREVVQACFKRIAGINSSIGTVLNLVDAERAAKYDPQSKAAFGPNAYYGGG